MFFFLRILRPPRSTLTDTLFPYTTLFRSVAEKLSTAMSHAYQAQLDANTPESVWSADTVYRSDLFAGKVALVSGGGSGIGRATALLFARLGATVVNCGRTAEKLDAVVDFARGKGATMLAMPTNVREPEQVDALFKRIHAECGRLDFTVNNAGDRKSTR